MPVPAKEREGEEVFTFPPRAGLVELQTKSFTRKRYINRVKGTLAFRHHRLNPKHIHQLVVHKPSTPSQTC